jgi:hypothetical protein
MVHVLTVAPPTTRGALQPAAPRLTWEGPISNCIHYDVVCRSCCVVTYILIHIEPVQHCLGQALDRVCAEVKELPDCTTPPSQRRRLTSRARCDLIAPESTLHERPVVRHRWLVVERLPADGWHTQRGLVLRPGERDRLAKLRARLVARGGSEGHDPPIRRGLADVEGRL